MDSGSYHGAGIGAAAGIATTAWTAGPSVGVGIAIVVAIGDGVASGRRRNASSLVAEEHAAATAAITSDVAIKRRTNRSRQGNTVGPARPVSDLGRGAQR